VTQRELAQLKSRNSKNRWSECRRSIVDSQNDASSAVDWQGCTAIAKASSLSILAGIFGSWVRCTEWGNSCDLGAEM